MSDDERQWTPKFPDRHPVLAETLASLAKLVKPIVEDNPELVVVGTVSIDEGDHWRSVCFIHGTDDAQNACEQLANGLVSIAQTVGMTPQQLLQWFADHLNNGTLAHKGSSGVHFPKSQIN